MIGLRGEGLGVLGDCTQPKVSGLGRDFASLAVRQPALDLVLLARRRRVQPIRLRARSPSKADGHGRSFDAAPHWRSCEHRCVPSGAVDIGMPDLDGLALRPRLAPSLPDLPCSR